MSSTRTLPVQSPDLRRTVALQMEQYKERLAQNMKRQRLLNGQKPADIAYLIGVDKRTYERWEEAETAPQPTNLKALADQWKTTVDALRPDLQAEGDQLNRIEKKLDRVLDWIDAQETGAELDRGDADTPLPGEVTGS